MPAESTRQDLVFAGLSLLWPKTTGSLPQTGRGFGKSDPMPPDWRVEECIQFIQEFLKVLDLDSVSLIGLSMGGAFAIGFALRAPTCVERLVLVDSVGLGGAIPGGLRSYLARHLPFLDELRWAVVRRNRTVVRRILCAPLVSHPELAIEEALDEIMLMARKPGAGAAFRQLRRSEYRWRGFRTNYLDRLSEIRVPTLIVQGADDPLVPVTSAERAHHRLRHSQLEIIPGCGHLPPIERPEVFNKLVCRFMESSRQPIRDKVRRVFRRQFPVAARPAGLFFWRRTPADSSRAKRNGKCLKLEPTSLEHSI